MLASASAMAPIALGVSPSWRSRRGRPVGVLDGYTFECPADGEMGGGFVEPVPSADEDTGTKRGVALVP